MVSTGQKASITKKISEWMIGFFACLNDDYNEIHFSRSEAQDEGFRDVVVQGWLYTAFIPTLMWKMGGKGTLAGEINLRFIKPVFVGDIVTVSAEIIEIKEIETKEGKRYQLCKLLVFIKNQHGKDVIMPTDKIVMLVPMKKMSILHIEPV